MASTTLRKLRSTLSQSSTPNPAQIVESIFQAIEQDFDIFHVFEAGEAISAREAVSISTSALTGTIDIDNGTKTLDGTGTAFSTELQEGSKIELSGSIFTVESITSDTVATVQEANNTGSNISDASPLLLVVVLADRPDDGTFATHCIGFAVSDTASGALCRIKSYGIMEGFSGLTAQEPYIVSDTAGSIDRLSQTAWAFNYQKVGYALTANLFFILLDTPQIDAPTEFLVYDASNYWTMTVASDGALTMTGFGSDIDFNIDFSNGTDGDFSIDTDTFFVDTSEEKVGINTSSPAATVHIVDTTEQFRLAYDGSSYVSFTHDETNLTVSAASTTSIIFDETASLIKYVISPKATTTAVEYPFAVTSNDSSNPLQLRFGLRTHATAGNRWAAIDVEDAGSARDLSIQPNGGLTFFGATPEDADPGGGIFGVVGPNAKATTDFGSDLIFSVLSKDLTNPLMFYMHMRTHATAGNRYGGLDVAEGFAGTPRTLVLQNAAAGSVLIGGLPESTTLGGKLQVKATTEQFRLNYSSTVYWSDTIASDGGRTIAGFGTDADFNIDFTGATDGDFSINGTQVHVDTSTGNVGIGTPDAEEALHLLRASAATSVLIERTTDISQKWRFGGIDASGSFTFKDVTNNTFPIEVEANLATHVLRVRTSQIVINEGGNDYDLRVETVGKAYSFFVEGSSGRVGINAGATPLAMLHADQASTTGAIPVTTLDQADVSEEFAHFIGTAASGTADQSLVAASDFTTPGALTGWVKIAVTDAGSRIGGGAKTDLWIPAYAVPTA